MQNTFCINCFMDMNVKEYIRENGTYLGLKNEINFQCDFCESHDSLHNERYDILDIESKKGIFYSEDIYVISQEKLIEKFIEIIDRHCAFIKDNSLNDGRLEDLIGIVNDIFYYETSDIIAKLAKYDFIKSSKFPFSESIIKDYNCGNKVDYVGDDILFEKKWEYKKDCEVFRWNTFCEHTKHKV